VQNDDVEAATSISEDVDKKIDEDSFYSLDLNCPPKAYVLKALSPSGSAIGKW
jgi:hypothetical protein